MTQHDPEAWLELARQALTPCEADRARVLSALEQRLDLPSNDGPGELPSHGHSLHSAHAPSPHVSLGVPSALVRWVLGAIVPIVGAAAVGMLLTTPTPRVPVLRPETEITAAAVEQSLPELLDRTLAQVKESSEPHPPEAAPPAPSTPPTKVKKPARKKCRTSEGNPCPSVKPAETAVASAPPPSAATPVSSLSKELAALREAQRALREGQPARALAVLKSFEQETEGPGAMQEERHAAATMARCTLTPRGETKALYEEFVQRYPNSAYAARLQRTCLPKNAR